MDTTSTPKKKTKKLLIIKCLSSVYKSKSKPIYHELLPVNPSDKMDKPLRYGISPCIVRVLKLPNYPNSPSTKNSSHLFKQRSNTKGRRLAEWPLVSL